MTELRAHGDTDVGQVRRGNEDSFVVGETLFAVADGMGGHVAGEVASATAVEALRDIDGKIFSDPQAALDSLNEAVQTANDWVLREASEDQRLRGMGTTLTAALVEHTRVHVAHVGDSRAYLLRDGTLEQVTHDHTLVQHLIDEGQITREEAATHPQRSIITRAIGVARDLEVDTTTFEVRPGDQLLLCSDGLTGVVSDDELHDALERGDGVDETVEHLISLANERGGPDNITVVLLRATGAGDRGAAAGTRPRRRRRTTAEHPEESDADDSDRGRRRAVRRWAIALGALALVAGLVVGGRWLLGQAYYVGTRDGEVVIYQGTPVDLGPLSLSWVTQTTDLSVDDVPDFYAEQLREGVAAADLPDARRIVANARRQSEASDGVAAEATPSPSPTPTP